jgi:hypothetical protein
VRTFKDDNEKKYGIKYLDMYAASYENIELKSFLVSDKELRAITLFDKDNDGINEILATDGDSLYLYENNGTLIWKYSQVVDTDNLEENHFTNIKVVYQNDGNHKIFVSGYSLYEFDKNGNFVSKIKPSQRYMVSSSGNYANPFGVTNDGDILLGQMGIFKIVTNASLLDKYSILLRSGWNLVSLPVDTTLSKNDFITKFGTDAIIWKYNSSTPKWELYAGTVSMGGVDPISGIAFGEGFWIKPNGAKTVNFTVANNPTSKITEQDSFKNASNGWHLFGTSQSVTTSEMQTAKSNISIAWKYVNGHWEAYSNNDDTKISIEQAKFTQFTDVNSSEGFWILTKQPE